MDSEANLRKNSEDVGYEPDLIRLQGFKVGRLEVDNFSFEDLREEKIQETLFNEIFDELNDSYIFKVTHNELWDLQQLWQLHVVGVKAEENTVDEYCGWYSWGIYILEILSLYRVAIAKKLAENLTESFQKQMNVVGYSVNINAYIIINQYQEGYMVAVNLSFIQV